MGMKKCPNCKELIQDTDIKCKNCDIIYNNSNKYKDPESLPSRESKSSVTSSIGALIAEVGLIIAFTSYYVSHYLALAIGIIILIVGAYIAANYK